MPCNTPPMYDYINCDGSITPPNPRLITNIVPAINLILNNGEYVEDGWKPTRKIKDWKAKNVKRSEYKESARRVGKTNNEWYEDKHGRRYKSQMDSAFAYGQAMHYAVFNPNNVAADEHLNEFIDKLFKGK